MFRHGGRNAGGGRIADGKHARAGLDEKRVGVAVVAALELDDLVAPRIAAGESNGRHAGFRAGADETNLIHGRHELADFFGDERFALRDGAEGKSLGNGFVDGGDDFIIVVAENHRPPGENVVNELLAGRVPHVGTLGVINEARGAADGAEGTHGRIHPARNRDLRTLEEFVIEVHLFNS